MSRPNDVVLLSRLAEIHGPTARHDRRRAAARDEAALRQGQQRCVLRVRQTYQGRYIRPALFAFPESEYQYCSFTSRSLAWNSRLLTAVCPRNAAACFLIDLYSTPLPRFHSDRSITSKGTEFLHRSIHFCICFHTVKRSNIGFNIFIICEMRENHERNYFRSRDIKHRCTNFGIDKDGCKY